MHFTLFRSWRVAHRVNAAVRAITEEALAELGSLSADGAGDEHSSEGEDADHLSGCEKSQRGSRRLWSRVDLG